MHNKQLEKKVKLLKQLLKLQSDYIELLGKNIEYFSGIAYAHGVETPNEDVIKGMELREQMQEVQRKIILGEDDDYRI